MTSTNKMGVVQLTILTMVNMMGSGIIMLPTTLAKVGTISIFSWLVTAAGAMLLAYSFAKCGMYSRKEGGLGGYAEYAFGKAGNFLTNFTYAISLVIANVGIGISAIGYLAEFLGIQLSPVMVALWTIALLWLTMVLNFGGAKITGQISSFTVAGVILPVVGLAVFGWFWFQGDLYQAAWNPQQLPFFEAVGQSLSMTLWALLGMESACANTDSVENPEKNVPRAVLAATLCVAIISILSTNVMAGIVPNADILSSTAPFGLTFARIFGGWAGNLVMIMMIIACAGSLLGWQFTIAQVFCSGAGEGYFPAVFSRVTRKEVPLHGMVILGIVQTLLALMTISPSLTEQFNILVDLAVVTNLVPFLLALGGLDVMELAAGAESRRDVFFAMLASLYSLYACYACGLEAMTYGALTTFAGWMLYGLMARRYEEPGHSHS